jgi:hypothetical protein
MNDSLPKRGFNANSLANLEAHKIKPGEVRNPAGGKKAPRIPDLLRRIGDETVLFKDGTKITKLEAVMRKVYQEAIAGRSWAVQLLAERIDGKVPLNIKADKGSSPLCIVLDAGVIEPQGTGDAEEDRFEEAKDITDEAETITEADAGMVEPAKQS